MSNPTLTKVGHGLAKVLGIKLQEGASDKITRNESVFSVSSADTYVEEEPTVVEWIKDHVVPSGEQTKNYFWSLFPFLSWIGRYNLQWLVGDLVAGITVGAVVIPQGMAYAGLAALPPEYGLYSSFMGVLIYWFFATSKDITIGPVAVMSTIVGNIVLKVQREHPELDPASVASALAVVAGGIVCALGLLRLGWLVDFISLTAISAFITGSAINIACGQVPTMMGFKHFGTGKAYSTRDSTYKVIINSFRDLPSTSIDAAMGLTALLMLYLIRYGCTQGAKRMPRRQKLFFFLSTLRTAFVILLYTLISWIVNRNRKTKPLFRILQTVPRGFKHARVPDVNSATVSAFASELPASVIVLLIEHIAISKSFGRINNYTINPSQELVAIGVTNLLGPFLGAYPATGSFSRTAIKSKAGVRTPLAGVITALVVLISIYGLTTVFYYIPSASLAAVIIHAVGDLIAPPNTIYQFWRISPLEVLIFFAGVFVTIFSSIENGIYTTISVSAALLLYRVFKARGRFLGKVKVHSVVGDHILDEDGKDTGRQSYRPMNQRKTSDDDSTRNIFLPIDHHDGSNPEIQLQAPYPGIFIYRFSEGYNYPNANHYLDYMVDTIFKQTRRTNPNTYGRPGDRPWNDPGPKKGHEDDILQDPRPTLKAVILDFSSVNNVDLTSVQHLIDVRNQLDRYAAPDRVEWHFASINNRWTKRALVAAGFGLPNIENGADDGTVPHWKPIFSVAEIGGQDSAAHAAQAEQDAADFKRHRSVADVEAAEISRIDNSESSSTSDNDLKRTLSQSKAYQTSRAKTAVVHGLNRPLFHVDLTSALDSAIASAERTRHPSEPKRGVGTESD